MKWTDTLVALATKAAKGSGRERTERARRKHAAVLAGLSGTVSSQILKDRLGIKHPYDAIRVMVRLGLIRKVRRIPAHFEYEVIVDSQPEHASR